MIRIPVWQYSQTSEIKAPRWDFNASGDSTWRHKSGSNLAQVMACCLMAPSHNLNHRWIIIKGVLWHSSESNFPNARGICSDIARLMTISQGPNFTALVSQLDFTRYPMQFNVWLMSVRAGVVMVKNPNHSGFPLSGHSQKVEFVVGTLCFILITIILAQYQFDPHLPNVSYSTCTFFWNNLWRN